MKKNLIFLLSMLSTLFLLSKTVYSMPLIGDEAPKFKANTTKGTINFPEDYKGKWIVLFSHPADFTPICTTEFFAFQNEIAKFNAINTKLIALSVDDLEHHHEWTKSIKTMTYGSNENTEITFPVIDDSKKEIAQKYGMLQKDNNATKTVRAVFVIDPNSKIRAIIYYPQSIGRYIPEIERLVIALQTSDKFDIATPANWLPGDDIVVPLDKIKKTEEETRNISELGIKKHSAYLYTQNLSKEDISNKLFK